MQHNMQGTVSGDDREALFIAATLCDDSAFRLSVLLQFFARFFLNQISGQKPPTPVVLFLTFTF